MFFKSIRWRLQIWHAVTLLAVLTVFGAMLYYLQRRTMLQEIDAELLQAVGTISAELRRPPRRAMRKPSHRERRDRGSDGQTRTEMSAGEHAVDGNGERDRDDRAPRGHGFGPQARRKGNANRAVHSFPGPPPWVARHDRLDDREDILKSFAAEFESSDYYFIAWNGERSVVTRTTSAPSVEFPGARPARGANGELPLGSIRQRGEFREAILSPPVGLSILVGRSTEADLYKLHRFLLLLVLTGVAVLLVGLAGGWWLASRAIRPIAAMTSAASAISVDNLSRRIDKLKTDDELGNLATVLNSMFDRLEASFQRQVQFTADASHELRTPLSVMMTQAELALSKPRSADEYREALQTCQQASTRMKSLIEALLVLARMDAGHMELKRADVDFAKCVRDCVAMVEPLAMARGIAVETSLPAAEVVGDANRLEQLTTNILTNAIRYNRDGGRVVVTLAREDDSIVLSVSDTGVGIAEDELDRIFDRFYRVDRSRSESGRGHGLGLSICQDIVSAHGGQISATSKVGVGTTFFIRLPRR